MVKDGTGFRQALLSGLRSEISQAVVLPFLLQRAALLLVVAFATEFIETQTMWHSFPAFPLLDPWVRWDSEHYLIVAFRGYGYSPWGTPDAFFPLYPWLVRLFGLMMPLEVAALLVANAAAFVAVTLLYVYVRDLGGAPLASRAVLIALMFPTSFFLSAAYAESTFLALAIGAVLAWTRNRHLLAAACTAAACLARPTGALALTVPFALHWLIVSRRRRELPWFILGSALGVAVLLFTHYRATGNPLGFVDAPTVQSLGAFQGSKSTSPAPFWAVLLDEGMGPNLCRRLLNLGAVVLTAACTWSLWRAKEIHHALITAVSVGFPLAMHGTLFNAASMARYAAVAFPIYLVMARKLDDARAFALVCACMGMLQAVLASLFGAGIWAE